MKLTELRCSACNGTLKLDETNPHIAVCEYCKSRFVVEDEGEGNVRLAAQPVKVNYVPIQPALQKKPSGWGPYGWKRGVALVVGFFLVVGVMYGPSVKRRWDMDHGAGKQTAVTDQKGGSPGTAQGADPDASGAEEEKAELTGLFADMVSMATGKKADTLTDEELARFRWIEYKYSSDSVMAGYSFENPRENPDASLTWLEFDRSKTDIDMEALSRFTGLKVLSAAGYVYSGNIKGMNLESLSCYGKTLGEVAAAFEDPGQLKELRVRSGLENLEGLGVFTGLERLSVGGSDLTDIKAMANMKGIKSLTLEYCDEIKDFSVLSVMDWLEELTIESEGIKDIGFVEHMPSLSSFSLSRSQILNVDSLEGNTTLESLSLTDCDELRDLSAVSGLTGLRELTLEVPYNCPQPDLAGLTGLRSLTVDGMDTVGYLAGMGGTGESQPGVGED